MANEFVGEPWQLPYSAEALQNAVANQVPRISSTTGNWEVWDISTSAWVDTGVSADASETKCNNTNIAPVEATSTASQAYAVNSFLVYNGQLYRVTAAITQGDTLTVGTNIAAADAGTYLAMVAAGVVNSFNGRAGAVAPAAGDYASFYGRAAQADINYYVATTGNDNNDGLSAATAFATIQHAVDMIPKTLNGHLAYINVADGAYTEDIEFRGFCGGRIYVIVDQTTWATTLNGTVLCQNCDRVSFYFGKIIAPSGKKAITVNECQYFVNGVNIVQGASASALASMGLTVGASTVLDVCAGYKYCSQAIVAQNSLICVYSSTPYSESTGNSTFLRFTGGVQFFCPVATNANWATTKEYFSNQNFITNGDKIYRPHQFT